MSHFENSPRSELSRRRFILNIGLFGGAAALAGAALQPGQAHAGSSKIDQRSAGYQATPKGKARCDNCVQWQAPDACKVVQGKIAPSGWFVLYAHKS